MMPAPFASVGKANTDAWAEQSRGADPAVGMKAVMTLPDLGQARRLAGDVLLLRERINAWAPTVLRGGLV